MRIHYYGALLLLFLNTGALADTPSTDFRHVHLMHLDGFRSDLFQALLEGGHLPHFSFLLSRGRLSLTNSTVDKSETMKVIQSYLTSKLDTSVVGWWQFNRTDLLFKNYWIDLADMIDYAIGTKFPLTPNLYDYITAQGNTVMAGFSLHRRGVPFENYARAYVEGIDAALSSHKYLDQAHATMSETITIYERLALRAKTHNDLPVFTTSLLAPADEFCHLLGVVDEHHKQEEFCYERDGKTADPTVEQLFILLDQDRNAKPPLFKTLPYFTKPVEWERKQENIVPWPWSKKWWRSKKVCIPTPLLTYAAYDQKHEENNHRWMEPVFKEARVEPKYALGMIFVDIELGRLINSMRTIYFTPQGTIKIDPSRGNSILRYLSSETDSLFAHTTFIFTGDHGMTHTPKMTDPMTEASKQAAEHKRHSDSRNETFLEYLNRNLGLSSVRPSVGLSGAFKADGTPELFGLTEANTSSPALYFSHLDETWLSHPIDVRPVVHAYKIWAEGFFDRITKVIKGKIQEKYYWLLIIKHIIGEVAEEKIKEHKEKVVNYLVKLRLKGHPLYQQAESAWRKNFFKTHARLVYGGGALNNVELFLPRYEKSLKDPTVNWEQRPSFHHIWKAAGPQGTLVDILRLHPAIGLIFIRQENGDISQDQPLPSAMHIHVYDRFLNHGIITVERDGVTKKLIFSYTLAPEEAIDPLHILNGRTRLPEGKKGLTYAEWNQLSLSESHFYHNAVSGMGSYLYSKNSAIGDITATHATGWNLGDNAGGHGGLHREEKLTMMLVSGPELSGSALKSGDGYDPSILDIAPTVIHRLYPDKDPVHALEQFAEQKGAGGFLDHMQRWASQERQEILNGIDLLGLEKVFQTYGIEVDTKLFLNDLTQLLEFIPDKPSPDFFDQDLDYRIDGNILNLD